MKNFKHEDRYMVVKLSLLSDEFNEDGMQRSDVIYRNAHFGKAMVECVVVESDWPEYDKVWKMIEQRVTGTTPNVDQVALDCMQRIMSILDADWKRGEVQLKAQIQCAIIDALEIVK
jgi:hypothetical protein